ncbi:MAG TPA: hypothetical protein VMT46_11220 [Anaerolineaceae bacterium]|nr:hypothetical protein [Anaerolineaceae bacterium]
MFPGTNNSRLDQLKQIGLQGGLVFGVIILTALIAFEAFNFSTTQYALEDLMGKLSFLGFRWATILSIAFCGIDFAGIARLFSQTTSQKGPDEVWYLFGAWLLAATMNAVLTWWGVSIALINHQTQSSAVIDPGLVIKAVPIVVAIVVWLMRILIIGTFSMAGDRIFAVAGNSETHFNRPFSPSTPTYQRSSNPPPVEASFSSSPSRSSYCPSHRPVWPQASSEISASPSHEGAAHVEDLPLRNEPRANRDREYSRPEPAYHELSANPRPNRRNDSKTLQ